VKSSNRIETGSGVLFQLREQRASSLTEETAEMGAQME